MNTSSPKKTSLKKKAAKANGAKKIARRKVKHDAGSDGITVKPTMTSDRTMSIHADVTARFVASHVVGDVVATIGVMNDVRQKANAVLDGAEVRITIDEILFVMTFSIHDHEPED